MLHKTQLSEISISTLIKYGEKEENKNKLEMYRTTILVHSFTFV
jgi:hypothetical protein